MTTRERINWVMRQPAPDVKSVQRAREHFCEMGMKALMKSGRDPEQKAPIAEIGRLYERYGDEWEKHYDEE